MSMRRPSPEELRVLRGVLYAFAGATVFMVVAALVSIG